MRGRNRMRSPTIIEMEKHAQRSMTDRAPDVVASFW
jgi:hypothetical protein